MSIEALIQAHTEALLANTEAVKLLTLSLAGRTPAKSEVTPVAEKPKTEKVKEEKTIKQEVEKVLTAVIEEKDGVPDFEAITYETLRTLVLKLASGGKREEIKSASAKHGLATPKDLIQDAKGNAIEPDQAKMAALYADLQAVEV